MIYFVFGTHVVNICWIHQENKGENRKFPRHPGTSPPPTPPADPIWGAIKLSTHYLRHWRWLKNRISYLWMSLVLFVLQPKQAGWQADRRNRQKINPTKHCAKYTDNCIGPELSRWGDVREMGKRSFSNFSVLLGNQRSAANSRVLSKESLGNCRKNRHQLSYEKCDFLAQIWTTR